MVYNKVFIRLINGDVDLRTSVSQHDANSGQGPVLKSQEDINFAAAQAAFTAQNNHVTNMWSGVFNFSNEAIKTAVLLNGGAAVACLAYLAAVHASDTSIGNERSSLIGFAVADFMIGSLMAGLCACLSYVAQYFYARANVSMTQSYNHPYVRNNAKSIAFDTAATIVHLLALAAIVIAYLKMMDGIVSAAPTFGFQIASKADLVRYIWSSLWR